VELASHYEKEGRRWVWGFWKVDVLALKSTPVPGKKKETVEDREKLAFLTDENIL